MKHTSEEICNSLNININDVLNIYPYGSRIYGTSTDKSDYDYIIVYKQSLLPSGAFKDNAISSKDRQIQGTCYSKGGFIDAINTYQMPALECLFIPDELIVKKTYDFKMNKFYLKEFVKKVVTLASASWHNAILSYNDENYDYSEKNVYHALRILDFGIQIKYDGKITDYSTMNEVKDTIYNCNEICNPKDWYELFIELSNMLKNEDNCEFSNDTCMGGSLKEYPTLTEDDVLLIKNEGDDHEQ